MLRNNQLKHTEHVRAGGEQPAVPWGVCLCYLCGGLIHEDLVMVLSWCSQPQLVLHVLKAVSLLLVGNSRGGNSKQGFILQQLCFQNEEIWKSSWQWSSLSPGFDRII